MRTISIEGLSFKIPERFKGYSRIKRDAYRAMKRFDSMIKYQRIATTELSEDDLCVLSAAHDLAYVGLTLFHPCELVKLSPCFFQYMVGEMQEAYTPEELWELKSFVFTAMEVSGSWHLIDLFNVLMHDFKL